MKSFIKYGYFGGLPLPVAALCIVIFGTVLFTGSLHRQPMIGDEVTHYFMLRSNAESWPEPSFHAPIENGWDEQPLLRLYPHPNGWHYIGGLLYRLGGKRFFIIQLYQSLFLLQLLWITGLWAQHRLRISTVASTIAVVTVGTLPLALLFSVAFYQDVAVTAQLFTAFYFLCERRRPFVATFFMILALWMKTSGIVLLPPFLLILMLRYLFPAVACLRMHKWQPAILSLSVFALCMTCVIGSVFHIQSVLKTYAGARYYPAEQVLRVFKNARRAIHGPIIKEDNADASMSAESEPSVTDGDFDRKESVDIDPTWRGKKTIIAHHPGDLRNPINFLIYGGGVFWLVVLLGGTKWAACGRNPEDRARNLSSFWIGLFYVTATAWQLRTAPDARFFLPAIPFFVVPLSRWVATLPRARLLLVGLAVAGLLQTGAVLLKTHALRHVSKPVCEAIDFLEKQEITPARIFMYPEGNYRLFPYPPEWYLNYWLREFWSADNDARLQALQRFRIGAIVVKKHLVAPADKAFSNLGIYPETFVEDIHDDPRFERVFENEGVVIYLVPPATQL